MENNAKKLPRTVLLITDHERLYGANRALYDMAVYLKEQTDITPIALIQRPGRLSEALTEKGIENICMLFRKWCYLPGDKKRLEWLRDAYDFIMRQKIKRVLAKKRIELVHTNVSTTCVGFDIARALDVPHVWHIREFVPEAFPYIYRLPASEVARRFSSADAVIAISRALADSFERKFPGANVKLVYDGVNLIHAPKEFAPFDKLSFCCVGRLCPQKNQMSILHALKRLKQMGKRFSAHFYGEGSDRAYEDALYDFVKREALSGEVVFHGYNPNVVKELIKYDVGLVMSSYEAFGRTTVEFMNASMPVIGANSGATPELITHGSDGLICPLDDTEALANAMSMFIDDADAVTRMGRAAYDKVAQLFSSNRAFENTCAVYADCITARAKGS